MKTASGSDRIKDMKLGIGWYFRRFVYGIGSVKTGVSKCGVGARSNERTEISELSFLV